MRRLRLALALAAVALAAAPSAGGALPWQARVLLRPGDPPDARYHLRLATTTARDGADVLSFLRSNPWAGTRGSRARVRRDYTWLRTFGLTEQRRALERLAAARHLSAWLCIHRYEASWRDGGAPYYGGLQMDVAFQLRWGAEFYRRWGTADRWPPWAQVAAAQRAHDSGLGYTPWPNTARLCGLL